MLCSLFNSPVTSSPVGQNIFLSNLFSINLSLFFSLNLKDQVSHPYRKTGKIKLLCFSLLFILTLLHFSSRSAIFLKTYFNSLTKDKRNTEMHFRAIIWLWLCHSVSSISIWLSPKSLNMKIQEGWAINKSVSVLLILPLPTRGP